MTFRVPVPDILSTLRLTRLFAFPALRVTWISCVTSAGFSLWWICSVTGCPGVTEEGRSQEISLAPFLFRAALFGAGAMEPGEVERRFGEDFEIERIAGEVDNSNWPPAYAVYLMTRTSNGRK